MIPVYLEVGQTRSFACGLEWPGWSRSGRDADAALQALADSAPRYAALLGAAGIPFAPPVEAAAFTVVAELAGGSGTDFGAPSAIPERDQAPLDAAALQQHTALLGAYWAALDRALAAAAGKSLLLGPRGGGRDLDGIAGHVLAAERAYLARLAWKLPKRAGEELPAALARTHAAALAALAAATRGETPQQGPRGGQIWPPRYFVRRVGWHVLDHIWEIEERTAG